jgi:MoaA/NifB/PqqE/SkfB family radical SAM enzyme
MRPQSPVRFGAVDFAQAPFLVIWETTQACGLACRHCRASARPFRDPLELTTAEGRRLVEEVARMGTPLIVFSGGDPVNRPDLTELIRHAKRQGLRAATIPAATERLTPELVRDLKDAGLDQMALSLDFPRADLHDSFRGVPGAFAKTLAAVGWAHEYHLPLQINTTVCAETAPYLEEMAALVDDLGVVFWEVFFLVLRRHPPGPEEEHVHREGDGGAALPPARGAARAAGGRAQPASAGARERVDARAADGLRRAGPHGRSGTARRECR